MFICLFVCLFFVVVLFWFVLVAFSVGVLFVHNCFSKYYGVLIAIIDLSIKLLLPPISLVPSPHRTYRATSQSARGNLDSYCKIIYLYKYLFKNSLKGFL